MGGEGRKGMQDGGAGVRVVVGLAAAVAGVLLSTAFAVAWPLLAPLGPVQDRLARIQAVLLRLADMYSSHIT